MVWAGSSCAARPSGPAAVAAVVLALGKGLMQQGHLRRPLTRERARSARLSGRPHPAALGKSGAVASLSAGETGLDRP